MKINKTITKYWLEYYTNEDTFGNLCSLCGNTGVIDTRGKAISPMGIDAGKINFCICPNGQAMRHKMDNTDLGKELRNEKIILDRKDKK